MSSSHQQRAWMLIEQGRFDLAMDEVRQALGESPQSGTLHAMLSLCLHEREQHREALYQAERAVHLEPDNWWTHYILAVALLGLERWNDAMAAAGQAAGLEPDAAIPHTLMGQIHLRKSRWRAALECADQALSLDPANSDASNVRAIAQTQLGRRDAAAMTIDGSLERDPQNATTHANRGWALLHAGEPHRAMEHFAEALRLEPDNEWARRGIVEAMKARNVIYRTFLRIALALGRLTPRARWIGFIGVIVLLQLMLQLPEDGNIRTAGLLLALLYMAFVAFMWSSRPLFDLLLMVNRFGRLALTPHEKRAAIMFGAAVAMSGLFIATDAIPHERYFDAIDYLLLTMAAGVAASIPPHGKWQIGYAATAAIYTVAAIFWYRWMTFAFPPDLIGKYVSQLTAAQNAELVETNAFYDIQRTLNNVFVWGSIAMTWLSAALHQRARPR